MVPILIKNFLDKDSPPCYKEDVFSLVYEYRKIYQHLVLNLAAFKEDMNPIFHFRNKPGNTLGK